MLLNSKVWHGVTKSQVNQLEITNNILLRYIFDAHPKTGIEWLYSDARKLNMNMGSLWQIK